MKKLDAPRLMSAKEMPPLPHSKSGISFSVFESEVVRWLTEQPEILQYLFDKVRSRGYIVYDSETKMWRGTNS